MRKTIYPIFNALPDPDNAHWQIVINWSISDKLERSQGGKRSNGIDIRNKSCLCQARCNPHHILLGDPNIYKTVGEGFDKLFDNEVSQVSRQQHHAFIGMGKF